MCGIWGTIVSGKSGLFLAEKNFIYDCMVAGAVRGDHGTGIMFSPAKDPNLVAYLKQGGNPYWLLIHKDFAKFSKVMEDTAKYVVGHNRWATRGEHTDENAHPFQHKHITMVHNGTIHSGLNYDKDVDVDSHALTIALANEGLEIFSKINGAFACVWHDAEKKTLNIAKNNERPLYMIKINSGDYFFASEEDMLKWLVKRSHKSYTNLTMTNVPIENNKLYTFDLEKGGEPEVTLLPEKKPTYTPPTVWKQSGKHNGECGDSACREVTQIKGKKAKKEELVRFHIKRKVLQRIGQMDLWLYYGKSLDDEAVWFQSKDQFPVGNTLYEGEIQEWKVDAYNYYGYDVMWYKIRTKSILIVDEEKEKQDLQEELDEELAKTPSVRKLLCIECNSEIKADEYKDSTVMKTTQDNWEFLCPTCTKGFMLPKAVYA